MIDRQKLADAKEWAEGQRKGAPNFHAVTLLDALTKTEAERDRIHEQAREQFEAATDRIERLENECNRLRVELKRRNTGGRG